MSLTQHEVNEQAAVIDLDPVRNYVFGDVAPSVIEEVIKLSETGFDVALIDTPDAYRPTPERQAMVDAEIERMENSPTGSEEFRAWPAISNWAPLTKRAVALHTLYNPHSVNSGSRHCSRCIRSPII